MDQTTKIEVDNRKQGKKNSSGIESVSQDSTASQQVSNNSQTTRSRNQRIPNPVEHVDNALDTSNRNLKR